VQPIDSLKPICFDHSSAYVRIIIIIKARVTAKNRLKEVVQCVGRWTGERYAPPGEGRHVTRGPPPPNTPLGGWTPHAPTTAREVKKQSISAARRSYQTAWPDRECVPLLVGPPNCGSLSAGVHIDAYAQPTADLSLDRLLPCVVKLNKASKQRSTNWDFNQCQ
jgi:hypothetical protein